MSLIDLIDKVATEPEPFYAPVPEAKKVYVLSRQHGVNHRFRVLGPRPGWWKLRPDGPGVARIADDCPARETMAYLANAATGPMMTALFPTGEQRWLAQPFSRSDAKQRGFTEPYYHVHLVRHNIRTGSAFRTIVLGNTLIYADVYKFYTVLDGDARAAVDAYYERLEREKAEARQADLAKIREHGKRQAGVRRERHRIDLSPQEQLELAGARMISLSDGHVTWEHQGREYRMSVEPDGTIESAGVCLDSTDRYHNLITIVEVMRRHAAAGRTY